MEKKEQNTDLKVISLLQLCKNAGVNYSRAYKGVVYSVPYAMRSEEKEALVEASKNAHAALVQSLNL